MKRILCILIVLLTSCRSEKRYHDNTADQVVADTLSRTERHLAEIRDFQKEMNDYFTDPGSSPLPKGTIVDFKGLAFFPVDEQYRVMAYLERLPEQEFFLMPTTTEHRVTQRVYGRVHFRLRQQDLVLPVYQDPSHLETTDLKDHLFLPFTDKTNGKTTYGGGRYLDMTIPEGDSIVIDFNKAYNPYCAYNPKYSCPLVPSENHLDMEVLAGMRSPQ